MMAFGEFGDKTQLITFTLAARTAPTPALSGPVRCSPSFR